MSDQQRQVLTIEVQFDHVLTLRGEQDVKRAIQDFKENVEGVGGKITRAELRTEPAHV